jgi:hypothetical protein
VALEPDHGFERVRHDAPSLSERSSHPVAKGSRDDATLRVGLSCVTAKHPNDSDTGGGRPVS